MQRTTSDVFSRKQQVKVMRRRAVEHDLDMYAAISGKPPGMPAPSNGQERPRKTSAAAKARPWSAAVLAAHLGNLAVPRLAILVKRPEIVDWVRRMSTQALERLAEAQARLASERYPQAESLLREAEQKSRGA